jgi:hypothetical protein
MSSRQHIQYISNKILLFLKLEVQMLKIRHLCFILMMLFSSVASSAVQMSIGIGLPSVNIGINVPEYPDFVIVPGYPVYYAPRMEANFFFYDGLYWVYQDDNWYESSWYNGPWWLVDPDEVPLYVLRVPVRYYRMPPVYFIGWQFDAPPRWGDHWGRDWNERRGGWDRWNRNSAPAAAPLPAYQRQYSGNRYPKQEDQQRELHQQNYHFQSRDPVVHKQNEQPQDNREQNQNQKNPRENVQKDKPNQERKDINQNRGTQQRDNQRNEPSPQVVPIQQNNSKNIEQQSPRNERINTQRSMPIAEPQKELRVKENGQKQEQRALQHQDQQQPAQKNQKQNSKSNNSEKESRQEQDQGRGKGRND